MRATVALESLWVVYQGRVWLTCICPRQLPAMACQVQKVANSVALGYSVLCARI